VAVQIGRTAGLARSFVLCTVCQSVALRYGLLSQKQLEIWGKAQRESARRPKSGWGKMQGGGVKFLQIAKSRGPHSNALAYAKCAPST